MSTETTAAAAGNGGAAGGTLIDLSAVWATISDKAISIALRLLACIIILIVGHFIIKLIKKRLLKSKALSKLDASAASFIRAAVKVLLTVVLGVTVVAILGIPMASVIAVLGSAGAAIALALQGTLGNLASGIMIVVLRPFRAGDLIEVGGNLGTVLEVGLFSTRVRTPDNKHVVMPNSTLTSSTIINYSSEELRRVDMVASAAYGTDIDRVKEVILAYTENDAQILKDPAPTVRMKDMNTSSIDFTVRVWVKNKDYWDVRFNLSENIYNEFKKNGIEIPFNQLDVHVK